MTVEQHQKVQAAIEALIEVESSLRRDNTIAGAYAEKLHGVLGAAREALAELNAPAYDN
jgi:predicted N-formylglutamate amidohydrolase